MGWLKRPPFFLFSQTTGVNMSGQEKHNIEFDYNSCRFDGNTDVPTILRTITSPMSVILQITRKCQFSCIFCSEPEQIPDPSLEALNIMKQNLKGVKRIFLSGGEPLCRNDFDEVLNIFSGEYIIGLPTNAIASSRLLAHIKEKVSFVNIGLDGPRKITTRIRGNYDAIMKGIEQFKAYDVPISLTSVVLRSTMDSLLYTCQIADMLNAKKVKFILPIPKGNALKLPADEYLTHNECIPLFEEIKSGKQKFGWSPLMTFTTWTRDTEGYSVLVYPNGNTFAWPVFSKPEKVLSLGNILNDPIELIWQRYPYKVNHIRKYIGKSIFVV